MTCWSDILLAIRSHLRRFRTIPEPVREELAQEAVMRVWAAEGVVAPRAMACRVGHNLAIDWLRRRREVHGLPIDPGTDQWQRQVEARIDAARAVALLAHAPGPQREVVRRCFLQDADIDTLVDEAVTEGEARHRVRDRLYKRRARGLAWTRRALEGGRLSA